MILACQNINKAFGTNVILKDASFHIEEKEKAAIVGINGAGKSTLLKIIMKQIPADSGEVILAKDRTIGYLAQHEAVSSGNTIYEELLEVKQDIFELELFNPARDFLKKRQDKIKNDLDTAAADKADARKLKEDYNAKIQNINAEAEEILAQARQKALDNEAKIIAEAKEEAARILSRANAQVELERKAAADDMKKEMIALASLMAEKAVAGAVDAKVQDTMVESTLKEIGEDTWRK